MRSSYKLYWLIFIIFLFNYQAYGQLTDDKLELNKDTLYPNLIITKSHISRIDTIRSGGLDSVLVKKDMQISRRDSIVQNNVIVIGLDSIVSYLQDTSIISEDTIVFKADTIYTPNDRILRGIYHFSQRKNIISRLIRTVYRYEPAKPAVIASLNIVKSDRTFEQYEDKIIRKIDIVVLDAFGYDIKDSLRSPKSILQNAGNFVHIKSRVWVVRNKLLFKIGDLAEPYKIAESERLLRQSGYIYDARIDVTENTTKDSVDLKIIVQDLFSLKVSVSGSLSGESVQLTVQDQNFIGLGQLLYFRTKLNKDLPGYSNKYANYYVNNISDTYISSNLYYNIENGRNYLGVGINRELSTLSLKWIGGVNYDYFKFPYRDDLRIIDLYKGDSLINSRQDIWFGLPTKLGISDRMEKLGKRFIISTRFVNLQYQKNPPVLNVDNYPYYSAKYFLTSLALFSRRTYKDKFIFRFGRTEDIPEGSLISIVGGLHKTDRALRQYAGISYSISKYDQKIGYGFFSASAGGFLNQDTFEQALVGVKSMYFTPLFKFAGTKSRQFIAARFIRGNNMILGEKIFINQEAGILGLTSREIFGNQKLVLNYEGNFFLPFNLVGFRMAFVLFADMVWINNSGKLVDKRNFYPGYGLGLKIRNDHLIFDAIQLFLGFYPFGKQIDYADYRFFQRSYSFYNFNDFNLARPDFLPFN